MSTSSPDAALELNWLDICRRADAAARRAIESFPLTADRAQTTGRGMGGDVALIIDRVAEDAILAELESLGVGLTAISEERGRVEICGGGATHVVIDPIDGSRNAKRGLAPYCVSIAVATGPRLGDVQLAYVRDCVLGEEFTAGVGSGARLGGRPLPPLATDGELELVGLEFIHPPLVAEAAPALVATGATRLRAIGSIALTLCYVAAGRLDGMVALGACRSVDIAAGQLILREAGGVISYLDDLDDPLSASLDLDWRSRVLAATAPAGLERLLTVG